jgi:protein required for attachment to host cells
MDTTWIVTADEGRARIFADADRNAPLQEIEDMVDAEARLRTAEATTDRLGPTGSGMSAHPGGGATPNKEFEPHQSHSEHAAEKFARDLAAYLLKAQQEGRFQRLVLAAAPKFLGALRKQLAPQLVKVVRQEINKDFTQSSPHQLREHLLANQK